MTPGTRIVTWLMSTLTVLVLLLGYHTSTAGSSVPESSVVSGAGPAQDRSKQSSRSTASKVVAGSAVDTEWGPVQVEITVQGGQITDVTVPLYPDDNPRDQEINGYALPILMQETLDAQSAGIDMVSGATVTSVGYLESLQSAIDEAGL